MGIPADDVITDDLVDEGADGRSWDMQFSGDYTGYAVTISIVVQQDGHAEDYLAENRAYLADADGFDDIEIAHDNRTDGETGFLALHATFLTRATDPDAATEQVEALLRAEVIQYDAIVGVTETT